MPRTVCTAYAGAIEPSGLLQFAHFLRAPIAPWMWDPDLGTTGKLLLSLLKREHSDRLQAAMLAHPALASQPHGNAVAMLQQAVMRMPPYARACAVNVFAQIHNGLCVLSLEHATSAILLAEAIKCAPAVRTLRVRLLHLADNDTLEVLTTHLSDAAHVQHMQLHSWHKADADDDGGPSSAVSEHATTGVMAPVCRLLLALQGLQSFQAGDTEYASQDIAAVQARTAEFDLKFPSVVWEGTVLLPVLQFCTGLTSLQLDLDVSSSALPATFASLRGLQQLQLAFSAEANPEAHLRALQSLTGLTALALKASWSSQCLSQRSVLQSLTGLTALQKLALLGFEPGASVTQAFNDVLRPLHSLTCLRLSPARGEAESAIMWDCSTVAAYALTSLCELPDLKRLRLYDLRPGCTASGVLQRLSKMSQLSALLLGYDVYKGHVATWQCVLASVACMPLLEYLDLSLFSHEAIDELAQTVKRMPRLRTLVVDAAGDLTGAQLIQLAPDAFAGATCKVLVDAEDVGLFPEDDVDVEFVPQLDSSESGESESASVVDSDDLAMSEVSI